MLAASEGLGYLVYTSRLYYRTDWIFVGLVVLGILGFLIDKILRYFGNKIFRYYGVKNQ
jgi:NitT/TauT family transport system permease protein